MYRTIEHQVENRWLPRRWQNKVWTTFEDESLIEIGTVFFDPMSYTYYAGEVTNILAINNVPTVIVRWYKSLDNIFDDTYPLHTMTSRGFWWLDPCMQ